MFFFVSGLIVKYVVFCVNYFHMGCLFYFFLFVFVLGLFFFSILSGCYILALDSGDDFFFTLFYFDDSWVLWVYLMFCTFSYLRFFVFIMFICVLIRYYFFYVFIILATFLSYCFVNLICLF